MISREELEKLQSFETEEAYRESSSLNYSLLKNAVDDPKVLIEDRQMKQSSALYVGSFVDKYFTDKDSLYKVFSINKRNIELSESFESVYQYLANLEEWEPDTTRIVEVCRLLGVFAKMSDDVIISRIPEGLTAKLANTRDSIGKVMLTDAEHSQCMWSIENIENDSQAMELITEHEGEIVIDQFKFEFPLLMDSGNTRMFKVMLDKIKFNFNTFEIIGIDIKTGKRYSHKFYDQFIEYRYDIQGILYYFGLLAIRKLIIERFGFEFNPLSSNNFKFLYSPKMSNKLPIIASLDEDWCRINGGDVLEHNNKHYPGCWRIINNVDWYITNQEFQNHKLVSEKRIHTLTQLSNYTT